MTLPKADKERLIEAPSFNRSPVAPVLSARSEPAKSIKLNLDLVRTADPSLVTFDCSIYKVKIT